MYCSFSVLICFCRTGEQHVGQSFWEPTSCHHGWTDVWSVYGNRIFWELHRLSLLLHWRHWRYSTFIPKQYVLLLLEQVLLFVVSLWEFIIDHRLKPRYHAILVYHSVCIPINPGPSGIGMLAVCIFSHPFWNLLVQICSP